MSAGLYQDPSGTWQESTLYEPHGCNADVAAAIRAAVDIPVAVVGGINSPEQAEELIAQGKCDLVVLCRQLTAGPLFHPEGPGGPGGGDPSVPAVYAVLPGSL